MQKQGASARFRAKKRIWLHCLDAKGCIVSREFLARKSPELVTQNEWVTKLLVVLQGVPFTGVQVLRSRRLILQHEYHWGPKTLPN